MNKEIKYLGISAIQNSIHKFKKYRLYFPLLFFVLLQACRGPVKLPEQPPEPEVTPLPEPEVTPLPTPKLSSKKSSANTHEEWRKEIALKIYLNNKDLIYPTKLPPLLYAVGVVETQIGINGEIQKINWMRVPKHSPEIIQMVEGILNKQAPFTIPSNLGAPPYSYIDTWLWNKNYQFQLHTLTQGQK